MDLQFRNQPLPFPAQSDQYKLNSHWNMLPENIWGVQSYCEARTGAKFQDIVFHGLQANLIKNFCGQVVTEDGIDYAEFLIKHSNFHDNCFNRAGWEKILRKHGGRLPLRIKALPEGTITSPGNAWFVAESMDEEIPWLPQEAESLLLHTWYPTTIATRSRENIKVIRGALKESSELDEDFARDLYVDFGYRACSCNEQAQIGGAAHGVNSRASDTVVALHEIHNYYGGITERGILYSVPASEHGIAQTYGKREKEYLTAMITTFPDWIVSVVADTNNIEYFVDVIVRECKQLILDRWKNGKAAVNKVVIRPDSLRFEGDTPLKQVIWIFQKLEDIFGVTVNKKGKKVLHPCIGVLWGDGISDAEIAELYKGISAAGYSVESLVTGQGGGLLVKDANRDTLRVALKTSAQKYNTGEWVDVIKDPLDKSKKSKSGHIKVIINGQGGFETINQHDPRYGQDDQLVTVFEMGELVSFYSYADIRKRAA